MLSIKHFSHDSYRPTANQIPRFARYVSHTPRSVFSPTAAPRRVSQQTFASRVVCYVYACMDFLFSSCVLNQTWSLLNTGYQASVFSSIVVFKHRKSSALNQQVLDTDCHIAGVGLLTAIRCSQLFFSFSLLLLWGFTTSGIAPWESRYVWVL